MMTTLSERPDDPRVWLLASRLATLPAAAVPVVVGTACAATSGDVDLGAAGAALCGALFIQIGTNLANDAYDYESGADTAARRGPVRAAQAGLLSPRHLRIGMIVAFALATLAGLYLTWVAGWPVVVIGLCSIAAGIAYTAGPYPLGYHGLGELAVLIFFGFVAVCGTAFVTTGAVPAIAWWSALPVGALATAILVVNNVRDRDTDAVAGKRTLAVRLGNAVGRAEYVALVAIAYLTLPALVAAGRTPWLLLPLATAPLAIVEVRWLYSHDGADLNRCLRATALLLLGFGATLAIALVVAAS